MDFAQIILSPFVWLLTFFYDIFGSYGLALIFFAIVIKVILFPFSLKGKKGMIQMNMLSGKMQQLQKAYGNNRERYNQEVQALYAREKVSPMSGCLWSFLPLIILLPLYAIIRQPLKYMMGLDASAMTTIAETLDWSSQAFANGWIKEAADFANTGYNQLYLASLITPENVDVVKAALGDAGTRLFAINFDFFGINLANVPQLKFWLISGGFGLFLLPVISAVTGFIFSWISMKTNKINSAASADNKMANQSSKMMMFVSPLISLWIGFSMPAGLCVYWIANNLLSMVQEFLSGKILKKDYERAAAAKAEEERNAKEEEKRRRREAAEERAKRIEEAKPNKGKKKPGQPKKPKAEEDDKIPAAVKEASRVGMRQYARGRAYDPNRYPITPYYEQGKPVEENALNKALDKESGLREVVEAQADADEAIIETIRAEEAVESVEAAETEETAVAEEVEETPEAEETAEAAGEEAQAEPEDEKK